MQLYLLVLLLQTKVELLVGKVFHRSLEVNWVLRLSEVAFVLLGRHLHFDILIARLVRYHRVVHQVVDTMIEWHIPQLL